MQNVTVSRELAAKFEGYKVLGYTANQTMVCLMDANREIFTYSFADSDKGNVIPERMKPTTLAAAIEVEGEEPIVISLNEIIQDMGDAGDAQIKSLTATVAQLTADLGSANQKIAALEAKETERRRKAIRAAVNEAVREYNECADEDERVNEDICDDIAEDEYTECEADGEFCGDARARECALARCTEVSLKAKKARKAAFNEEHKIIWGLSQSHSDTDPLAEAFRAINKD